MPNKNRTSVIGLLTACALLAACEKLPNPTVAPDTTAQEYNALGSANAPATFIEYSDYQCPFCRRFTTKVLPMIKEQYIDTGKVRFIFKDFPLEIHAEAIDAAIAAHCAGEQDRYFPYHDVLFDKAADRDAQFTQENFTAWATDLGLDTARFSACLQSDAPRQKVEASIAEAKRHGVRGTPSFLINGKLLAGAQPFAAFVQLIEENTKALPEVADAVCTTDDDCPAPRAFPPYCSKSDPQRVCITTGTPSCKLGGSAESECVTIIIEECTLCADGGACSEGVCGEGL